MNECRQECYDDDTKVRNFEKRIVAGLRSTFKLCLLEYVLGIAPLSSESEATKVVMIFSVNLNRFPFNHHLPLQMLSVYTVCAILNFAACQE